MIKSKKWTKDMFDEYCEQFTEEMKNCYAVGYADDSIAWDAAQGIVDMYFMEKDNGWDPSEEYRMVEYLADKIIANKGKPTRDKLVEAVANSI